MRAIEALHDQRAISRIMLPLFIIVMTIGQTSCRQRSRSAEIAGQAPVVSVQLRDLAENDRRHPNFIYEAMGCGSGERVVGTLSKNDDEQQVNVDFAVKGAKLGEVCQIEVRIEKPDAYEHKVRFNDRELLMYSANDAVIRQDIYGKYIATANMRRNYYHKLPEGTQKHYTVTTKLTFPEAQTPTASYDGNLSCEPALFPHDAKVEISGSTTGKLTIGALYLEGKPNKHKCRRLQIFVNNKFKYFANLTGSFSREFVANPDGEVVLSEAPITLVVAEPPPIIEGILVDTERAESCDPETEVFDTIRRECVALPSDGL